MTDLSITPIDSVYIKIDSEKGIAKELSDFFTFTVPNHQYTPAYRNKLWDGQIRLFNLYTRTLYRGLVDYVHQFARDRNYTISDSISSPDKIPSSQIQQFIDSLHLHAHGNKIKPYDYQIKAIEHAVNNERCLLLSPTGSGKSMIIYSLVRLYDKLLSSEKKILIIVPTTGLVSQMYNDFKDYSSKDNWDIEKECHVIFSGQDKVTDKRIVISTWQSIYKMKDEYFDSFGAAFGDECHFFKSKSLTTLMTKLKNCSYRIGTTGTLDGTQTHKLVIEGLFGKVYNVTTTKELMDSDVLSDLKINCLLLKYKMDDIQEVKRVTYQEEIKWIVENERRNEFISNLTKNINGNTLLLFNYVDSHGKPLYELIKKKCPDKKVFLIHGGTEVGLREEIRKIVDSEEDAILVASYGTCSTGINIRNIHNIVFASPSKSVIRVLQSIGRGLRKSSNKDSVKLYDICDDLCYKKYVNHTFKHMNERIKIYINEKFDYDTTNIRL